MKTSTIIKSIKFVADNGKLQSIEAPENMSGKKVKSILKRHNIEVRAFLELSKDSTIESTTLTERDVKSAVLYAMLMDEFEGDKAQFYAAFYLAECNKLPSKKQVFKGFETYCDACNV